MKVANVLVKSGLATISTTSLRKEGGVTYIYIVWEV